QNQGAALATYTVFMDMSLGVTGPLAGLVMTLPPIHISEPTGNPSLPYAVFCFSKIYAIRPRLPSRKLYQPR
ncbi:hypothetical protein FG769_022695, partial [Salmonella enterica subsp. enterica serovar Bareilly]